MSYNPDYRQRRPIDLECGEKLWVKPRGYTNEVGLQCTLHKGHLSDHQGIIWFRYSKEIHHWSREKKTDHFSGLVIPVMHTFSTETVKCDVKASLDRILETTCSPEPRKN